MIEVVPLRLGDWDLPEGHPAYPGHDKVHGFLIKTQSETILVDTGIDRGNSYVDKVFQPKCADLSSLLSKEGLEPNDISIVVNSHLHFDHCGNNILFPRADIFIGAAELEDARADKLYTVREWFDYETAKIVPVTIAHEIAPGVSIFPTPGHTSGHISVAVTCNTRTDVIAARAIYTIEECLAAMLDNSLVDDGQWNDDAYCTSRQAIFDLNPDRIFFSHDAEVWER